MERIVITGATGFLGRNLAKLFWKRDTRSLPWYVRTPATQTFSRSIRTFRRSTVPLRRRNGG